MSDKPTSSFEGRLADMLTEAAKEGFDMNKVIEQIPAAERSMVRSVLSGLAAEVAYASYIQTAKPATPAPSSVVVAKPIEVEKLVELLGLEDGYNSVLETQKAFQLLEAGENAPDFGQVLKTFTPEMLAIAQSFQSPELRLVTKGRSFDDLISAMDGHKTMPHQNDVSVDNLFSQHSGLKPENWGAYIIEASKKIDIQAFDDTRLIIEERLKRFYEHKKATGVSGMDRWKYAQIMMQALKDGRPIDAEFWTMLDEDPALSDSSIPDAGWNSDRFERQILFSWDPSEIQNKISRFRRSVGGDVKDAG